MFKNTTDKGRLVKFQVYKPGFRLPVFPSSSLLVGTRHQFFLRQLEELSALSPELFDALYRSFIYRFVEFVQVLPVQTNGPLGELMNEGLVRGFNSLHQLILRHADISPLERYAVFTAATLLNVANVVVNQKIFVTDEEGSTTRIWQPFEGSLLEGKKADYYKIIPLSSAYQRMNVAITPLLARQLLPESGFLWIAEDLRIFADWLDALRGDAAQGGRLVHVIQWVKEHLLETGLPLDSLPLVTVPMEESPATAYGDSFFAWLKEGIASGEIKVNTPDAGVHVTKRGVFIERGAAFKQYIDLHVNVPVNMFSVYQQFGNLFGLAKLSGSDHRFEQLFSETPDFGSSKFKSGLSSPLSARGGQVREGIVISDPSLIFMKGETPSVTKYLKSLPSAEQPERLPNIKSLSESPEKKIK